MSAKLIRLCVAMVALCATAAAHGQYPKQQSWWCYDPTLIHMVGRLEDTVDGTLVLIGTQQGKDVIFPVSRKQSYLFGDVRYTYEVKFVGGVDYEVWGRLSPKGILKFEYFRRFSAGQVCDVPEVSSRNLRLAD